MLRPLDECERSGASRCARASASTASIACFSARRSRRGDSVTITVAYGPLDATFTGSWREDGTFSGGWRPNPGADETANVPYDIGGHRLE
jgi:hypothetical protein